MRPLSRSLILLLAAAAAAGCSTPVIKSLPTNGQDGQDGLLYALPKAQASVQVLRFVVSDKDLKAAQKAVDDASALAKESADALPLAERAVREAETEVKAADKADPETKAKINAKLLLAKVLLEARKADAKASKTLQTEAQTRLEQLKSAGTQCMQEVAVQLHDPVPDRNARYMARHDPGLLRDDNYKLKISNGMLGASTAASDGQLQSFLVNLASAFSGMAARTSQPALFSFMPEAAGAPEEPCNGYLRQIFDPSLNHEVNAAAKELKEIGLVLRVIAGGDGPQSTIDLDKQTPALIEREPRSAAGVRPSDGLVYRAPLAVRISVSQRGSSPSKPVLVHAQGLVPDATTALTLRVDGDILAQRSTDYEFVNGMPVSLSASRPSKLNALARIPVAVLKAILEVPASILKLRIDLGNQEAKLTEAQVSQIEAQLKLIEAQDKLKAAQTQDPP